MTLRPPGPTLKVVQSVPAMGLHEHRPLSPRGDAPDFAEERKVSRLADWVAPAPKDEYRRLEDKGEAEVNCQAVLEGSWSFLVSRLPILDWLPKYDVRKNLFNDFIGGLTIAWICVVQTLAHAAIATTAVIQGPYCAFVPPLIYAILGTSPHASISSGAIAAILIADQLQYFHSEEERTELASLLALVSGLMLVLMGLFRAAFLVRFLSQSLISGFVTGGAVLICEGQLKNLLGLKLRPSCGFFDMAQAIGEALPETNRVGLVLGLVIMGVLQAGLELKRWATARLKGPGPHPSWLRAAKILSEMKEILSVGSSIAFAYATADSSGEPILPVVGTIPPGLPSFVPPWRLPAARNMLETQYRLHEFIMGGFLIAITTYLTTFATAKKQALLNGYNIDASQEMFALGMAGACGSFFGSFPPSGSLSRTGIAAEVGVKTQMSGLMNIVVVSITLVYLTRVLFYLPNAALAAIILRSTWNLIDFQTVSDLWKECKPWNKGGHRRDFVVWWIAFILTIWLGVLYGVGSAVIFSLLMIIRDAAMPRVVILGRIDSFGSLWRDKEVWSEGRTFPGIAVIEFRGPLSFASAAWFQEEMENKRMQEVERGNDVEVVILAFGSVHDLDSTAIDMLKELLTEWRKRDVSAVVADAKSRVRLLIEEHLGNGKNPLLDQPAFMISIDDAIQIALRKLKKADRPLAQDDSALQTSPSHPNSWRNHVVGAGLGAGGARLESPDDGKRGRQLFKQTSS